MKYLLDSNAVIAVLKSNPAFLTRMRRHHPRGFGISAIVAHELFCGAYKGQRTAENLARVEPLRFKVLDFDREDARRAGELRAARAEAGTTIGPYNVLIAGQALARSLILITRNTRQFGRAKDLRVQDWEL